jgi:hypothetical protein
LKAPSIISTYLETSGTSPRLDIPPEISSAICYNFSNGTKKPKKLFADCQTFVENFLISEFSTRLDKKESSDKLSRQLSFASDMHANSSDSELDDVAPLRTYLGSRELRTLDQSPRSAPIFIAGPSEHAPLPGLSVSGETVGLPLTPTSDISKLVECFTKSGATSVGNFHLLSSSEIKVKNPNWDHYVVNLAQDVIAPTLTGSRLDDSASNEYHSELSYALLEEPGSCGLEAALAELRASKPIGVIFVFLPSLFPGDEILIKGPKEAKESLVLPESLEYQPHYLGVRFDAELTESKPIQGTRLSLVYRVITRPSSVREERRTKTSHTSTGSRTVSNMSLKLLAETSSIGSRPEDDDFSTLPVDPEDTFDIDMLILNATLGSDSLSEEDPEGEMPLPSPVAEDKSLGPVLYVPAMGGNRNFVSYATVEGLLSVLTEQQGSLGLLLAVI